MTRVLTIFVVLSVLCNSCSSGSQNESETYGRKSMDVFAHAARKNYGIALHSSTGAFQDKIYLFAFDFYVMKEKSVDEVRELMRSLARDFKEMTLQDKNLKTYLAKDPVSDDMLTIQLSFVKIGKNNLTTAILKNGTIYYYFTEGKDVVVREESINGADVRQ